MIFKLYKMYSQKSLKNRKIFKNACIISVILAVSIILSQQLILNIHEKGTHSRVETMNGADIKILDKDYLVHQFSEKQAGLLKSIDQDMCTLAYSSESNIIYNKTVDSVALTVFNNDYIISKRGIRLNEGEAAISDGIAERLNLREGDFIYVKLHSDTYPDREFKVAKILGSEENFSVAANEYELAEETLGSLYLVMPEIEQYNLAYLDHINDENVQKLKDTFEPDFEVRSVEDLYSAVFPRIEQQINLLKLISATAMILSSICLVWSFLVFIMDRKEDFLIFKKVGIRTRDLSGLLLLELYSILLKGICVGVPIGMILSAIYLYKGGMIYSLTVSLVGKAIFMTLFLVLAEATSFSLIPILKMKQVLKKCDQYDNHRIPVSAIIGVIAAMVCVVCIYTSSIMGVFYFAATGIVFGLFYLLLTGLYKLILRIMTGLKFRNFLLIQEIKGNLKISSFSLTLINVIIVICLLLVSVLPMVYSSMEKDSEDDDILYSTVQQSEQSSLLDKNQVVYDQYYRSKAEILQVNHTDIVKCLNEQIAEEYREESIDEVGIRNIDIYEDKHMPDKWKNVDGIMINNIYKNVVDFKEGDIVTIKTGSIQTECRVAGTYENSGDLALLGIIPKSSLMEDSIVKQKNMTTNFILKKGITDHILQLILYNDKNAYIEKNQQLMLYLEKYVDKQKLILVNNVITVGFSGFLMVLLGQIILFSRKKEYYYSLWKIGMDHKYMMNNQLWEKLIYSILQTGICFLFYEPLHFLIISETSGPEYYHISAAGILVVFLTVSSINLLSTYFPLFLERKMAKKAHNNI